MFCNASKLFVRSLIKENQKTADLKLYARIFNFIPYSNRAGVSLNAFTRELISMLISGAIYLIMRGENTGVFFFFFFFPLRLKNIMPCRLTYMGTHTCAHIRIYKCTHTSHVVIIGCQWASRQAQDVFLFHKIQLEDTRAICKLYRATFEFDPIESIY